MKFKTEIKYYGNPIKVDKNKGEIIIHKKEYETEYLENAIQAMHKELIMINKKYKKIFSIRFYLNEIENQKD